MKELKTLKDLDDEGCTVEQTCNPQNRFLILNLEDEIDVDSFVEWFSTTEQGTLNKVKDIAVPLVNAILKAKGGK